MAVQFKEFNRPAFSGDAQALKKKVMEYCNRELKCFRVISISEAKGVTDDFYRITVWYDDEAEKYEHLMSSTAAVEAGTPQQHVASPIAAAVGAKPGNSLPPGVQGDLQTPLSRHETHRAPQKYLCT